MTELIERKYYPGKHCYHWQQGCAGADKIFREKVSLINARRQELTACGKCDPPTVPDEYAVCNDCGWKENVAELDRDRGYKGACPECGSPCTASEFDCQDETIQA